VLFPTVTFAVFFMAVWPATWLVARWPRARQLLLLGAGALFYAYFDDRFVALLAGTIVANYVGAQAIHELRSRPAAQRAVLWLTVTAHLAVLGVFKYYGFFTTTVAGALDDLGLHAELPALHLVLPVGISFFTFQAIAYLIEVRRGALEPGSLLEIATWLSFFPTVASGPITRASELLPQLRERPAARIDADEAFLLITRGLFKKIVLSSFLATAIADDVFASPGSHSAPEVLGGVYGYAAQLYVDFSGYSDMAIGCALLLGIRLPRNFDAPYAAQSVTEFWTRWHMTLSRWLRDFLFTPLALHSRRTTVATCRTIVVVMLVAGLWHGAAWTFVAFGAVHGIAMAVERALREHRRRSPRPAAVDTAARRVGRQVLTFHVVCLGWVFFRADSIDGAGDVLARLVTGWGAAAPAITPLLVVTLVAVLAVQHVSRRSLERIAALGRRLGPVTQVVLLASALVVTDVLGPEGVAPFLYFGF
jgi:D-alanyl-lipoteichoic acid acyltransferase DltB (MBOAT superfamily)